MLIKIHSAEIVVFDVETTGLFPQDGDRIVEVAAMKVKNGQVVDKFYSLVNPKRPIPLEATAINKITEDMVADAPTAEDILPRVIDFISGGCVAGHNARFDLGFLCYELSLFGRRMKDETPVVDTLKMAKDLLPYLSSYKLSYLARSLGVTVTGTHRAMADVELTVAVMLRMMEMAADKKADDVATFLSRFGVEKPSFKLARLSQDSLF